MPQFVFTQIHVIIPGYAISAWINSNRLKKGFLVQQTKTFEMHNLTAIIDFLRSVGKCH